MEHYPKHRRITQIFKDKPLVGYRRLPNLKDILTSSSINYPSVLKSLGTPLVHVPVCTRLGKCTYCTKIKKVAQITSFHSKRIFKCQALPPKHKITCELSNVIYMINCNQCGLQYIGETKRPIRNRMYEHYSSRKGHSSLKALHTEKSFCEKYGIKHLAMDGGSNQPKCHNQAQAPTIILYLGIPHTPPSRHQHVCLKLCPLTAPITQVPPLSYTII